MNKEKEKFERNGIFKQLRIIYLVDNFIYIQNEGNNNLRINE